MSPATLDADLARVRGLLGGTELTLERSASRARLRGTESAQRRLLSRLAHTVTAGPVRATCCSIRASRARWC